MDDVVVIGELGTTQAPDGGPVTISDEGDNPLPKHAILNEDGSVTLPLAKAVTLSWRKPGGPVSEDTLTELVMHRLTGKDMMAIQSAARDQTTTVALAQSARIPMARFKHIFERMDGADITAAGAVVSNFLGSGPKTGP